MLNEDIILEDFDIKLRKYEKIIDTLRDELYCSDEVLMQVISAYHQMANCRRMVIEVFNKNNMTH